MPQLTVSIKDKIARTANEHIICGNTDYTMKFEFDEEWAAEPVRIARFIWNKQFVDVQFTGDTCEVPLIYKTNTLAVGVYAGDLKTTTPAVFACHQSILCEDAAEPSIDPSEYEEIMRLLNVQANEIELVKIANEDIKNDLAAISETTSKVAGQIVRLEEKVNDADDAIAAVEGKADEALARNIFTDEEKTKLSTLENYDDTEVKAAIDELETNKADKTDLSTLENEIDATNDAVASVANDLQTAFSNINNVDKKADEALARNIFTDEEKAKLAGITNPMTIKGRVDTVDDLPAEATIGWFYFVGLENASSYAEYCYSEKGWEFVGTSEEGVDLSNYYTKAQVDNKLNDKLDIANIDTELDTYSENPVQNKVIKAALDGLQEKINDVDVKIPSVDDEMSDTSTNPIQNKVIKKYVDDIVGDISTTLTTIIGA